MPNFDELQRINHATACLEPKTATAMRFLFLITEEHNEDMNYYIAAALREDSKVPLSIARVLYVYNLVNEYCRIPAPLKDAIRNAVSTHHLKVDYYRSPDLKPKPCLSFFINTVLQRYRERGALISSVLDAQARTFK